MRNQPGRGGFFIGDSCWGTPQSTPPGSAGNKKARSDALPYNRTKIPPSRPPATVACCSPPRKTSKCTAAPSPSMNFTVLGTNRRLRTKDYRPDLPTPISAAARRLTVYTLRATHYSLLPIPHRHRRPRRRTRTLAPPLSAGDQDLPGPPQGPLKDLKPLFGPSVGGENRFADGRWLTQKHRRANARRRHRRDSVVWPYDCRNPTPAPSAAGAR